MAGSLAALGGGLLAPGDTIDRYTVQELIGAGGTAIVYKVVHQTLGTPHALKVLSVTSPVIRDRMLTEGRVQASLRHLNVVAVTDVLDVHGAPGLLMEFIEGPSLEGAIQKFRIPLEAAETLFLGVLSGVRQAHLHGLVHRDLKPANVLLASSADGFVPKVTDFGLAKVIAEAGATGTGHTRAGVALGTPAYMAPEQIRDARKVDQRADIFALGCILYELVTKQRVYPGNDTIAIYNAVLDGEFTDPRELVPDLPDRVHNAILGCLVQDREHRIPTCDVLLDVLNGRTTWEIPDPVEGFKPQVTAEEPRPEEIDLPAEERPELPLAQRGPEGETPPPAPGRDPHREDDRDGLVPMAALLDALDAPVPDRLAIDDVELPDLPSSDGLTDELSLVDVDQAMPSDESLLTRGFADGHSDPGADGTLDPDGARRRSLPWVVAAAVAIGLMLLLGTVGVGVWWVARAITGDETAAIASAPRPEPAAAAEPAPSTEAPVPTEPAPTAPEVRPAPEPVLSPAPPAPPGVPTRRIGAPAPSAPVPVPVPAARTTPAPAPAPARTAPAPAPAATTAPAPAPAPAAAPLTVKILSSPPTASLSLDGAERGRTPAKLELPAGRYAVTLASGGEQRRFEVSVAEGAGNTWCYSFDAGRLFEGRCP